MNRVSRPRCILALLMLLAGGCALKARQTQTAAPKSASRQAGLPSWAPENSSPEFLRAAKLLKPIPPEAQPYSAEYIPCWELFGSLTDKQIAEFMTEKTIKFPSSALPKQIVDANVKSGEGRVEGSYYFTNIKAVRLPMQSLTPRQKELFDKYVAVYEGCNQGAKKPDLLVDLYHAGAKQDLSNVNMRFQTKGRLVSLFFSGIDKAFPIISSGRFAQVVEPKAPQPQKKKRSR
jgi:hypothetical protein